MASSNTFLTNDQIAQEFLIHLENKLGMLRSVYRGYQTEYTERRGARPGASVRVRKPVKFVASSGATLVESDITETYETITVNQRKHVGWSISSQDLTLSVAEFSRTYLEGAAIVIANEIDLSLTALYKDVPSIVGTPGNTPDTYAEVAAARQRLVEQSVMPGDWHLLLDPAAYTGLSVGLSGAFNTTANASQARSDDRALREAEPGRLAGFQLHEGNNVQSHVAGSNAGAGLTKGASQVGASIAADDFTASQTDVFKAGDIITFAGCNEVNSITKASLGRLKQFTVTADVDSDGTGNATIPISPAIVTSGAYQNCTASPTDNGAITLVASHQANLAYHRNAFALVMVPLEKLDPMRDSVKEKDGISCRVAQDSDITNDKRIIRIDALWGVKTIYPELATRLAG